MGNTSDMKPFSAVFPQMRFRFDDILFGCLFFFLTRKWYQSYFREALNIIEGFYVLTFPHIPYSLCQQK